MCQGSRVEQRRLTPDELRRAWAWHVPNKQSRIHKWFEVCVMCVPLIEMNYEVMTRQLPGNDDVARHRGAVSCETSGRLLRWFFNIEHILPRLPTNTRGTSSYYNQKFYHFFSCKKGIFFYCRVTSLTHSRYWWTTYQGQRLLQNNHNDTNKNPKNNM